MASDPVTKHERWQQIHQPYELAYHKQGNFRWRDHEWNAQWNAVLADFMEFSPDTFTDQHVMLDVGCGSRPCFDWFTGGAKHYIDPLLSQFVRIPKMAPYWKDKADMYSAPAEETIDGLVGKCDYVHCWNVLDHTYGWMEVLQNIVKYTKKGGICLMGTDLGIKESKGHPGIDDPPAFFRVLDENFTTVKKASPLVHRRIALKLIRK
jgi:hypothetical protein